MVAKMKRQDITEGFLLALYMGTLLALIGGLTYEVIRDYKQERKQKVEQSIKKKQNMQSCVYFNQVRQK